jgi:hypothetical protein
MCRRRGSTKREGPIAAEPQRIEAILDEASVPVPDAPILALRDSIDRCSPPTRLEEIFAALEADGGDWAAEGARHAAHQIAAIDARSRCACSTKARPAPTFADEMRQEYAHRRACRAAPRFHRGRPRACSSTRTMRRNGIRRRPRA